MTVVGHYRGSGSSPVVPRNWTFWKKKLEASNNHRILQQLDFHVQHFVQTTNTQDLNPRPLADNTHVSVLAHEMMHIEPNENPTRTLTWKVLVFLSHIKCRSNDDRFPLPLRETWFYSGLGVPIPTLVGPHQECDYRVFRFDSYGDHVQTCQTQSETLPSHDWVVNKLGALLS
jgi:hypothetical protein